MAVMYNPTLLFRERFSDYGFADLPVYWTLGAQNSRARITHLVNDRVLSGSSHGTVGIFLLLTQHPLYRGAAFVLGVGFCFDGNVDNKYA